jgi:hypothetical protein
MVFVSWHISHEDSHEEQITNMFATIALFHTFCHLLRAASRLFLFAALHSDAHYGVAILQRHWRRRPCLVWFCPVEYFVPGFVIREMTDATEVRDKLASTTPPLIWFSGLQLYHTDKLSGTYYCLGSVINRSSFTNYPSASSPVAFGEMIVHGKNNISTCLKQKSGLLARVERFGYIELPITYDLRCN